MIISAHHKFVFVAIPKTGTHSVRQALRAHLGPDDIEQVGLFVQKKFPIPELAQLQHGHLSLAQVRPYFGSGDFEDLNQPEPAWLAQMQQPATGVRL